MLRLLHCDRGHGTHRPARDGLDWHRRTGGDTIVEVLLAFTVFTLVSVGAFAVMNKGINMVDRSLEITLVREQIDAQAEILRYAHDTGADAWQSIRDNLGTPADAAATVTSCPSASDLPVGAFVATTSDAGDIVYTQLKNDSSVYTLASTYSKFTFHGAPSASGIWVVPVSVEGADDTYDMYIRTCWQSVGNPQPETLGTIVRLYDPPHTVATAPPPTPLACTTLDNYGNNLIRNGTFSISAGNGPYVAAAAMFESDLPNRGPNIYPDDAGVNGTTAGYTGGFSIQSGSHTYGTPDFPDALYAQAFPGDPGRGVPPSNTYFYSNPNQRVSEPPGTITNFEGVLWRQTVPVESNATYDFTGYFDNILLPDRTFGVDPRIQLRADGDPLMEPVTIYRNPDTYQRVSLVFKTKPGQTSVVLDIYDYAHDINGDDFGMTALALRKCL